MRKHLCTLAALALASGLLCAVPGEAQQGSTAAGQASPASQIPSGTPPAIVNKPIDVSAASKPLSLQNSATSQQQSNKVFNIPAAVHTAQTAIFKPTPPKKPVGRPGSHNPSQSTKAAQLPAPKASSSKLLGFIPWF